jgi:hypothetical protein
MLAAVKPDGCVYGSIPGLARLANVTLEETQAALKCFLEPDPFSRTQDNEGRRIEVIDGGWKLLNHAKYDDLRNDVERAEYKRKWDREHRPSGYQRQSDKSPTKSDRSDDSPKISDGPTPSALTSTSDKEQKKTQQRGNRGSRLPDDWRPSDDLKKWARSEFPDVDLKQAFAEFADYWRGVPGSRGCKLDWDATFRNRVRDVAARMAQRSNRPGRSAPDDDFFRTVS